MRSSGMENRLRIITDRWKVGKQFLGLPLLTMCIIHLSIEISFCKFGFVDGLHIRKKSIPKYMQHYKVYSRIHTGINAP
jgi:hypothetical protein